MEIQDWHKNMCPDKMEEEMPLTASASPPSTSSSPAHEFSFSVSLHHHHPPPPTTAHGKSPPLSAAVDLSPADDIFFHGHLLPLQLFSHLSISPRSSTNSLDSFTLPIRELLINEQDHLNSPRKTETESKNRVKPKSFTLFGLSRFRKGYQNQQKTDEIRQKKALKFDVSNVLKKYIKMVRPLLSFGKASRRRRNRGYDDHKAYSFSGSMSSWGKQEQGRRGEYSAPASMKTSPTNSGLLLGNNGSYSSESSMEELQAAIQAAIAHCKNSIAVEEGKQVGG